MKKLKIDKSKLKHLLEVIKKIDELTTHQDTPLSQERAFNLSNKDLADHSHYRLLSEMEKSILTLDAFDYFYSLTQNDQISYEIFERIMYHLYLYLSDTDYQIDLPTLTTLIEVMSFADYQEKVIAQTLELYIHSPELLTNIKFTVH